MSSAITRHVSPAELARTSWNLGMFDPTTMAVVAGGLARTGPSLALPYAVAALRFPRRVAIGSLTPKDTPIGEFPCVGSRLPQARPQSRCA